jgi:hypothetical protein
VLLLQVTVTTHSQGGKGLELYIDGKLAGQTLGNKSYVGAAP